MSRALLGPLCRVQPRARSCIPYWRSTWLRVDAKQLQPVSGRGSQDWRAGKQPEVSVAHLQPLSGRSLAKLTAWPAGSLGLAQTVCSLPCDAADELAA